MLPAVLLGTTGLCILFAFLLRLYLDRARKCKPSTVPGFAPTDSSLGNLTDITEAGSFHQFLRKLHKQYGKIASFWFEKQFVVSTCHPDTFRPQTRLFDRPCLLFKIFEPLVGKSTIQYLNGEEGQSFRRKTDPYYSHESCCDLLPMLITAAKEVEGTWTEMARNSELVPLREHMITLALRGITMTSFGDHFKDDNVRFEFAKNYDICWYELERRIDGDIPDSESDRERKFQESRDSMRNLIAKIVKERKSQDNEDRLFVDDLYDASDSDEQTVNMAITYVIGGFHTTGNLMTWMFYFLASRENIVANILEELDRVLGVGNDITPSTINSLIYCRQVIDESLRLSVLAPWAARYSETDMNIAGYTIPKETPIVQSLGLVCESQDLWEDPEKFDPERFDPEKAKTMDSLASPFFGFAGKRKCPGYRFAYFEALTFMSILLRRFKIHLADPGKNVVRKYGLVTCPDEEIYIRLELR